MLNFGSGQSLRLQNNHIGCHSHINNMLAFHTHTSHGNTNGSLTVNQNTQFISSSNSLSEIVSANINAVKQYQGQVQVLRAGVLQMLVLEQLI